MSKITLFDHFIASAKRQDAIQKARDRAKKPTQTRQFILAVEKRKEAKRKEQDTPTKGAYRKARALGENAHRASSISFAILRLNRGTCSFSELQSFTGLSEAEIMNNYSEFLY